MKNIVAKVMKKLGFVSIDIQNLKKFMGDLDSKKENLLQTYKSLLSSIEKLFQAVKEEGELEIEEIKNTLDDSSNIVKEIIMFMPKLFKIIGKIEVTIGNNISYKYYEKDKEKHEQHLTNLFNIIDKMEKVNDEKLHNLQSSISSLKEDLYKIMDEIDEKGFPELAKIQELYNDTKKLGVIEATKGIDKFEKEIEELEGHSN